MNRLDWFLLFQVLLIIAALADFVTTTYGLNSLNGLDMGIDEDGDKIALKVTENNGNYKLVYALIVVTFLNAVFYFVRPELKWQIPRMAVLGWHFLPAIHNLILILSVTV